MRACELVFMSGKERREEEEEEEEHEEWLGV